MKIQRTLAPTAVPITYHDLLYGLAGLVVGETAQQNIEAEVRQYFGVKHVFLVSSGKAALTLILVALKSLSSRPQVLIPAYTCYSVPSAIVRAGLNVSVCDIDPTTLDFDFTLLRKSLNASTLCVIPTHLLGLSSDIDRIKSLCDNRGLYTVEDAAQAMGGKRHGRLLGTLGDVAFFSLGRGKNITCGSGGIIVTNSDELAAALQIEYDKLTVEHPLRMLRNLLEVIGMRLLIHPRLYWLPTGLPFLKLGETHFNTDFPMHRMDSSRAGLLKNWKECLEQANSGRSAAAVDLIERLAPGKRVIRSPVSDSITYLRLPVMLDSQTAKQRICTLSKENGFGVSPLYPTAVPAIKQLQGLLQDMDCPAAATVAERLVTIPVHHLVRPKDREKICTLINSMPTSRTSEGKQVTGQVLDENVNEPRDAGARANVPPNYAKG